MERGYDPRLWRQRHNLTYYRALRAIYLGHCDSCLNLIASSNDQDLKNKIENPLSAMLISSCIAGMETYLHDRLSDIVLSGDSNTVDAYISLYNTMHGEKNQISKIPQGASLTEDKRRELHTYITK